MNVHPIKDVPGGLTRRARSFVGVHGVKIDVRPVEGHRQWWLERDVPAAVIDRMAAYQRRWGGLFLPPASPLHATVEGWVESLALAHHASMWAQQVTKLVGDDVDGIELDGYEPVREVMGLADTWWRGPDSLVALYTGEATSLDFPRGRVALIYSGLDEWGLRGGVEADDG